MFVSVPSVATRIHWYVCPGLTLVSPSVHHRHDGGGGRAVSVCPTCAVPVIVGAPVAGCWPPSPGCRTVVAVAAVSAVVMVPVASVKLIERPSGETSP